MCSLRALLAASILLFAGCPRKARDDSKGAANAANALPTDVSDGGIDGDVPEPAPMPGSGGSGDAGPF